MGTDWQIPSAMFYLTLNAPSFMLFYRPRGLVYSFTKRLQSRFEDLEFCSLGTYLQRRSEQFLTAFFETTSFMLGIPKSKFDSFGLRCVNFDSHQTDMPIKEEDCILFGRMWVEC